jgi:hypothetical protein
MGRTSEWSRKGRRTNLGRRGSIIRLLDLKKAISDSNKDADMSFENDEEICEVERWSEC